MGFIADIRLQPALLQHSSQTVPDMVLEMEELQVTQEGRAKYIFWASGDDFGRFSDALSDDPTVEEFASLLDLGERRLYRVTFDEEEGAQLVYPSLLDVDIVYIQLSRSDNETYVRAHVPSREALKRYREACEDRDIAFHLEGITEEESDSGPSRYNLTDPQREALILAYKEGYFGDSRETNLEEIANLLGISRQALAGRLRRGEERLIENTLL